MDYEAYKEYYSIGRPPFYVHFRNRQFRLLAIALFVMVLIVVIMSRQSGINNFNTFLSLPHTRKSSPMSLNTNLSNSFHYQIHICVHTIGGELHCNPEMMKPSPTIPDDVNRVRPADIKVIGAMGDSITLALESINYDDDPYDVYPGNSYITGGDGTLKEHITVANILRLFNPNIIGMSYGSGKNDNSSFNVAVVGQTSIDIPRQARDLIQRMRTRGVDLANDWKLISIFIGINDLGGRQCLTEEQIDRTVYKEKLEEGINILRKNSNRTIVSIISMWNPRLILDAESLITKGEGMQCGDSHNFIARREHLYKEYRKVVYELQNEKRFDHKDFTVVVQGFLDEVKDAYRNKNGEYDKSFYGRDIYHLSKYGNAVVGKFLWNSLLEPVGRKTTKVKLADDSTPLMCPTEERPYIQTVGNRFL
ncbi:GDSL-like protein [Dictyocaulus viviparus]|uniref:GDSL-like protein n=1 Tax=Dictyocaulus viviparus TaxID=29172 RepID=A0A0D8XXJ3_DICVI|nr:GDSL-like protein [Dictyocaulus viviparus]